MPSADANRAGEAAAPSATSATCPTCGGVLISGACTACAGNGLYRFVHREILLLGVLSAIAGTLFLVTRAAAAANRGMRRREAAVWFDQGRQHLHAGHLQHALTALRRATVIDPAQARYRLSLAEALAVGGQHDAARRVLLGLRERAPEDPEINLSLARLEARRQDLPAAVRYYENALYGTWPADQETARRQLRVELIRYLLAHGEQGRALSQLLVLSANLPEDVLLHLETAQLFMSAGDARRALEHFRLVLRIDAGNGAALAGAGEAAFDLADYNRARRYLRGVPRPTERVRELATLADLVVSNDPLGPRLTSEERRRRTLGGLKHASARLEACLAQPRYESEASDGTLVSLREEAHSMAVALNNWRLRAEPEALEQGADLTFRIVEAADAARCKATDMDRALSLIGRRHRSDQS